MPDYSGLSGGLGVGQAYQQVAVGGQRFGVMTTDAFDPIAAPPIRMVGARPVSVVSGATNLAIPVSPTADSPGGSLGGIGGSVWDPRSSLVPWLLVGLGAFLYFFHVHWK